MNPLERSQWTNLFFLSRSPATSEWQAAIRHKPPSQSDHVQCLGRPENPGVLTNRARVRRSAQNSQHWIHLQGPRLSSAGLGSNLSFAWRVQFSQFSTINSQSFSASIHPPAPTLGNEREYLNFSFAPGYKSTAGFSKLP